MPWRETLCPRLSPHVAGVLRALTAAEAARLTELRARIGRPLELRFFGGAREEGPPVDAREMEALVSALSGYARYAVERQMAEGYIPLPGGHRAGVCGRLAREEGGPARLCEVTSVCVRVARHVPGAGAALLEHAVGKDGTPRRLLLLGPPGCGKTTALRDAALALSDARGLHVAVCDEREELFGPLPPGAGRRLDVLSGADKASLTRVLLRAMAPDVLVTDEIGRPADVGALLDAAGCGVGLLASAHASGAAEVRSRPALRALLSAGAFDSVAVMGRGGGIAAVLRAEECLEECLEECSETRAPARGAGRGWTCSAGTRP